VILESPKNKRYFGGRRTVGKSGGRQEDAVWRHAVDLLHIRCWKAKQYDWRDCNPKMGRSVTDEKEERGAGVLKAIPFNNNLRDTLERASH
jgi:hypothetical protein